MNKISFVVMFFAVALFGQSCNQDSKQKMILGKWKGTFNLSCNDTSISSVTNTEYVFDENGKCFIQDTRDTEITQGTVGYKINGDSISFDNESTKRTSTKFIEFISADKLVIIDKGTDCIGTLSLDKTK